LKNYLSYLYYRFKLVGSKKGKSTPSLENLDELQQHNIVGYRTGAGLKKLTIRHINAKARKDKFILNHSYKKQLIYDDGSNIVRIPLELPHLLNMSFKKKDDSDVYMKDGIAILYTDGGILSQGFFVINGDSKYELKYINSLQNYCSIIRNDKLDFSLVL